MARPGATGLLDAAQEAPEDFTVYTVAGGMSLSLRTSCGPVHFVPLFLEEEGLRRAWAFAARCQRSAWLTHRRRVRWARRVSWDIRVAVETQASQEYVRLAGAMPPALLPVTGPAVSLGMSIGDGALGLWDRLVAAVPMVQRAHNLPPAAPSVRRVSLARYAAEASGENLLTISERLARAGAAAAASTASGEAGGGRPVELAAGAGQGSAGVHGGPQGDTSLGGEGAPGEPGSGADAREASLRSAAALKQIGRELIGVYEPTVTQAALILCELWARGEMGAGFTAAYVLAARFAAARGVGKDSLLPFGANVGCARRIIHARGMDYIADSVDRFARDAPSVDSLPDKDEYSDALVEYDFAKASARGGSHREYGLDPNELHGIVLLGDLGLGPKGEPRELPSGLKLGASSMCFGEYL